MTLTNEQVDDALQWCIDNHMSLERDQPSTEEMETIVSALEMAKGNVWQPNRDEIKKSIYKAWVTSNPRNFGEAMELATNEIMELLRPTPPKESE